MCVCVCVLGLGSFHGFEGLEGFEGLGLLGYHRVTSDCIGLRGRVGLWV